MEDNRAPVTEARFALTILICVLVAVGYVVLLRLSGPGDSPMEVQKPVTPLETEQQDETAPLVLPTDPQQPQMTKRPTEPTTPSAHNFGVLPAGGSDLQRR
jgi:hypothetical protein